MDEYPLGIIKCQVVENRKLHTHHKNQRYFRSTYRL